MTITYDVAAFQASTPNADYVQALVFPGNSGYLITGLTKLAQRFIIELMTEKGTLKYLPNRGSYFVTDAKNGKFISEINVLASFSSALLDITPNLQNEENSTTPTNEKFSSATINSIGLSNNILQISITIYNKAGTSLNTTIPLSFNHI